MSRKKLRDVRITLPKGVSYELLDLAARLHGAPSMSKYILTAAMSYTDQYIRKKKEELDERRDDTDSSVRNPTESVPGEVNKDNDDTGDSDKSGILPSTSESRGTGD